MKLDLLALVRKILLHCCPIKTVCKRATKVAVAVFQGYLHEKEKSTDFLSLPVEELKSYIITIIAPFAVWRIFPEAAIIIQYSTPI